MEKEIRMRDKHLFLPEVVTDGVPDTHKAPAPSAECKEERKNHYLCLCCGCLTFPVPQNEARENYQKIGACSENMLVHVRKPRPEEISK